MVFKIKYAKYQIFLDFVKFSSYVQYLALFGIHVYISDLLKSIKVKYKVKLNFTF
jgi:hypothetical protein